MQPLRLPVGVTLKTERIYNEKGERYSRFRDFLPSFVLEGYDNNDVKFTGDIEQDKKTAGMFLHPSIALVAEMNADKTKVTGYQLAVMPYFKEMPVGWKASTEMKQLMQQGGPLVPERRQYTTQQLRFGRARADMMYQRRLQRAIANEEE